MFCDLSLAWQEANGLTQRERLVMAIRLGIDLFALDHDVSENFSDRDKCVRPQTCYVSMHDMLFIHFGYCRCSMQPLDLACLQSGTSSLQDALRMQQGLAWKHSSEASINQLTRLTLHTEDSSVAAQAFTGAQAAAASYDLLAIEPLSDRVLQQVLTVNCFKPIPKHGNLVHLRFWHLLLQLQLYDAVMLKAIVLHCN